MADKLFAFDHHGMPGVVPPLEPHYDIGMLGKQIHDLALAFIAPLGSDNYNICHRCLLKNCHVV